MSQFAHSVLSGANIIFDTDSTVFSAARFGIRGKILSNWNFPE